MTFNPHIALAILGILAVTGLTLVNLRLIYNACTHLNTQLTVVGKGQNNGGN